MCQYKQILSSLVLILLLLGFVLGFFSPALLAEIRTEKSSVENFHEEAVWNGEEDEMDNNVDPIANSLIDDMLDNLRSKDFEEYKLHKDYELDIVEAFLMPFDPCIKQCKIKFVNGTVYGLKNMSRYDNVVMSNDGDDLIIQVRLQVYDITVNGILSLNLIGLSVSDAPFRSYAYYQIQYLDVAIGDNNQIRLRDLRVETIEGFRIELLRFQDSKILKKFSDMITKQLLAIMKDQLKDIATRVFFPILASEILYLGKDKPNN